MQAVARCGFAQRLLQEHFLEVEALKLEQSTLIKTCLKRHLAALVLESTRTQEGEAEGALSSAHLMMALDHATKQRLCFLRAKFPMRFPTTLLATPHPPPPPLPQPPSGVTKEGASLLGSTQPLAGAGED